MGLKLKGKEFIMETQGIKFFENKYQRNKAKNQLRQEGFNRMCHFKHGFPELGDAQLFGLIYAKTEATTGNQYLKGILKAIPNIQFKD